MMDPSALHVAHALATRLIAEAVLDYEIDEEIYEQEIMKLRSRMRKKQAKTGVRLELLLGNNIVESLTPITPFPSSPSSFTCSASPVGHAFELMQQYLSNQTNADPIPQTPLPNQEWIEGEMKSNSTWTVMKELMDALRKRVYETKEEEEEKKKKEEEKKQTDSSSSSTSYAPTWSSLKHLMKVTQELPYLKEGAAAVGTVAVTAASLPYIWYPLAGTIAAAPPWMLALAAWKILEQTPNMLYYGFEHWERIKIAWAYGTGQKSYTDALINTQLHRWFGEEATVAHFASIPYIADMLTESVLDNLHLGAPFTFFKLRYQIPDHYISLGEAKGTAQEWTWLVSTIVQIILEITFLRNWNKKEEKEHAKAEIRLLRVMIRDVFRAAPKVLLRYLLLNIATYVCASAIAFHQMGMGVYEVIDYVKTMKGLYILYGDVGLISGLISPTFAYIYSRQQRTENQRLLREVQEKNYKILLLEQNTESLRWQHEQETRTLQIEHQVDEAENKQSRELLQLEHQQQIDRIENKNNHDLQTLCQMKITGALLERFASGGDRMMRNAVHAIDELRNDGHDRPVRNMAQVFQIHAEGRTVQHPATHVLQPVAPLAPAQVEEIQKIGEVIASGAQVFATKRVIREAAVTVEDEDEDEDEDDGIPYDPERAAARARELISRQRVANE